MRAKMALTLEQAFWITALLLLNSANAYIIPKGLLTALSPFFVFQRPFSITFQQDKKKPKVNSTP